MLLWPLLEQSSLETKRIFEMKKPSFRKNEKDHTTVTGKLEAGSVIKRHAVGLSKYPKVIEHKRAISELHSQISKSHLYNTVAKLSLFPTRYYNSKHGLTSSQWILATLDNITSSDFEVQRFDHDWLQFSIVVTIPGKVQDTVIIGSHIDSSVYLFPWFNNAPGADDNASGVAGLVEILRVISLANFKPYNTVQFHFYSAEEVGLRGSREIFTKYYNQRVKVLAMLQLDQIGFAPRNAAIGVVQDLVDSELAEYVTMLIDNLCSIKAVLTVCGYACSDSASAHLVGYPGALVTESLLLGNNKFVHTSLDTIDRLNFTHVAEFVKLGLGYIYELGYYTN